MEENDSTKDIEKIYEKYAMTVYRYLLTQCHNEEIAKDLMQETFLRVFYSINRFNGECKLSVWLCQIAKHLWYQYVQKHKYEITENNTISDNEEKLSNKEKNLYKNNPEEDFLAKSELKEVLRLIRLLPEQVREVMYLRMTGELSFKDIGEIMGKSENWARVTYFRGKEKIKRKMEDI